MATAIGNGYDKLVTVIPPNASQAIPSVVDRSIDFVAYASSPWTALSIDTAVLNIAGKCQKRPKGIVCIRATGKGEFIIHPADFACVDCADVTFQYHSPVGSPTGLFSSIVHKLNTVVRYLGAVWAINCPKMHTKAIYIVSPLRPNLQVLIDLKRADLRNRIRLIFVVVDEGFLSYGSERHRSLTSLFSTKRDTTYVSNALQSAKRKLYSLPFSLIRYAATRDGNVEKRFLFSKCDDLLKVNDSIAQSYRKVLRMKYRSRSQPAPQTDRQVAMLITQPFLEYLAPKDSDQLLIAIVKALQSLGFEVVIKLHPRDDIRSYSSLSMMDEVSFADASEPVENLLAQETIDVIAGFTSSALLNAKVLFGVRAISFAPALLKLTEHSFLVTNCREFIDLAGNYVDFVNSPDELTDLLAEASMTSSHLEGAYD